MKKILLISLITVLAVGLVGCNNTVDVNNPDNVIESGDSNLENNTENNNATEDNESENVGSESGEQEEDDSEVEDNKENESTEQPEENKSENKPVEQPEDNKVQEGNTESKKPENQNPENNETEDNVSGEDETVDNTENEIPEDDEIENGEEEIVVSELEKKLNTLMEKSQVIIRMPMAMPIEAETAFTYIGLTADEFNSSVANAIAYESMIMPANQSICLIELKDGANVSDIKNKVITNCDPNKWICMSADKCLVVDSGKYVMLVMSTPEDCDALKNAFGSEFGNAGEALTK